MDVQIRFFDAGTLSDPARFADAYARVSAPRRAKIDRLRSDAARRLSLAAGVLLTDTLAELGIRGAAAEEAVDENGKPCLPRCPELHFSLSHSGSYAMCAAAEKPVGCDIQLAAPRSLRVAERYFTQEEQARILTQETEEARQEMFYRIWTLKESFVKCLGLGLRLPLDSFSAYPAVSGGIVLAQSADPGGFRLFEPSPPAGFRCAVCIRI